MISPTENRTKGTGGWTPGRTPRRGSLDRGRELRLGDQRGGMKRHETTQTGGVQDSRNTGLDRMRRRGKGMNRKELQKEVLGTDRSNEAQRRRQHSETLSTRQSWSPGSEHRHRMRL